MILCWCCDRGMGEGGVSGGKEGRIEGWMKGRNTTGFLLGMFIFIYVPFLQISKRDLMSFLTNV